MMRERRPTSTLVDALKHFVDATRQYMREELETNPHATKAETLETVVEGLALALIVMFSHYSNRNEFASTTTSSISMRYRRFTPLAVWRDHARQ